MTRANFFSDRVIFDHLPKTAGQAITAWLAESLGNGSISPNAIDSHRKLIQRYGGLYSIISAHVHFRNGEGLDPRYKYFTLIREPIDRAISWIFFVLNNIPQNSHTLQLTNEVQAFVESDGEITSPAVLHALNNPYVEHFSCIYGNSCMPDNEKVAYALNAIKNYDVVGIYQEMSAFLKSVAHLLNIKAPENINRINVTLSRPKKISELLLKN